MPKSRGPYPPEFRQRIIRADARGAFPSPFLDDDLVRLREPRWEQTTLWEDLRRRAGGTDPGTDP
jgi:hypothetical protein